MNPAVPLIPDNAPFSPEQRAWLNGFLAGIFSRGAAPAAAGAPTGPALAPLGIIFGSQTGTAEGLAKKLAKEAGKRGFAPTILDMARTDLARLAGEKHLLVIVSTYGDGEPPDGAKALHAALKGASGSPLAGVRFSVCALGDTNYPRFCQCGKEFDTYLERLGAARVVPRVDCDLDYDAAFTAWIDTALGALTAAAPGAPATPSHAESVTPAPGTASSAASPTPAYSRKNPFPAPILTVRKLNGPGSAKEVNHVELSLDGSGLVYEAGDALGVIPRNCPELVTDVLSVLGCDGEEAVPTVAGEIPLRRALSEFLDLGKPTAELLGLLALVPAGAPPESAATAPFHVIDALAASSAKPAPRAFVAALRKLQPRLYSISSSPKAHPGQVHLTVGAVRYEKDGRPRKGVCSTFLADRALATGHVGVFVHSTKSFRPPANGDVPMIMVGPGTGIAPFRAFLEERRATGAKGRNWLFFGDQKAACDYLYREEITSMKSSGLITRLDLAFSRDQPEKIYVQDRLLENASELFAWLEAGAHFYVCGDASRMAKDVDAALHRIVEKAGARSSADAAAYVESLKASKRYARDVY